MVETTGTPTLIAPVRPNLVGDELSLRAIEMRIAAEHIAMQGASHGIPTAAISAIQQTTNH